MNFNAPLYAAQYAKLRSKSYAGTRLVSLFSDTVIFAGQVNSDLTTPQSWARFAYTSITVGAYTDVEDLFTLYIGTANDIKLATFEGYCRGEADATYVNCNESSQDFVAGAYFWVIRRINIKYVQSRPSTDDPTTAVELVNYDETYQGLLPMVQGLRTGYVGYVNPLTGYLRLGFDVSATIAAESGAAISDYLYDIPGAVLVAGSFSEAIVIVDIPYGELYGKCTVTDSGSRAKVRRFGIKAHDPELYPPNTSFEGGSISATLEQGYTATLPAFRGVDDVLTNAFGFIWRADEQFDGETGSLYDDGVWADITNKELTSNVATLESVAHPFVAGQTIIIADVGAPFDGTFQITATTDDTFSYIVIYTNIASTGCSGMGIVNANNMDFVGWFSREDDPLQADATYSVISTARMTFTGVGPRLSRLTAQLLAIVNTDTPTRWGDITDLTPWRAMWHFWSRYTTVTTLCDVSSSDTTNSFLFSELSTQGRNALAAVQEIAQQINANVEFAPWGSLSVNRDANYLDATQRSALSVVGSWGSSDASSAPRSIDPNPDTGKVDGVGAYLSTTTNGVTAFTARAPGHAQDEGQGDDTIAAQVLAASDNPTDALDELRQRVGSRFNLVNLRESLDVKHNGNFVGLPIIPSRSQYHWWTLQNVGGPNNVNRINYDTTVWWTVDSVTMDYNAKGVFNVRVRYRRLCDVGDPGDDTMANLPAPGQQPSIPDLGFDAFPFQLPELSFPDTGLQLNQINPVKLLPPSIQGQTTLVKTDGDTLLAWSATRLELVRNFIALRYPQTTEINPPTLASYLHKMAIFDPANKGVSSGNNKAYDLASNGTNSRVFQAANVFAPVPIYLTGNTFGGVYTLLRSTGTASNLMVYGPGSGSPSTAWSHTFDFTTIPTATTPEFCIGYDYTHYQMTNLLGTGLYGASQCDPSGSGFRCTGAEWRTNGGLDPWGSLVPGSFHLVGIDWTAATASSFGGAYASCRGPSTATQYYGPITGATSGTITINRADQTDIDFSIQNADGADIMLKTLTINGIGFNPFDQPAYTHVFDFTVDDGGWVPLPDIIYDATWDTTGWHRVGTSGNEFGIIFSLGSGLGSATITEISSACFTNLTGSADFGDDIELGGVIHAFSVAVSSPSTVLLDTGIRIEAADTVRIFSENLIDDVATFLVPSVTIKGYGTDPFTSGTAVGARVRLSSDGGINFGSAIAIGNSPGPVGGFDVQKSGAVSYAACTEKVRKATTLGGSYSDHTDYGGANPVCVAIPWYLWGFNDLAHLNTSNANPDYATALDTPDTDGGTLYLVDGTTAVKTDVTPVSGITFDSANCVTVLYGTHIAVVGKVSGVYKLYTSPDAGVTWTLAATLGTATFIRGRRGDTRAFSDTTGVAGQLFVADGDIEYTSKFASVGIFPRTLPISALGVDVLG